MKSLAKPRRITIVSSNGQRHTMMAKPKDDLRKDARLMDFNAIINKLLKKNSESRRRQLRTWNICVIVCALRLNIESQISAHTVS